MASKTHSFTPQSPSDSFLYTPKSPSSPQDPLLCPPDMDFPDPPSAEGNSSWFKRAAGGALAAVSLGMRITQISPAVNALSSLGIGLGTQLFANSFFKGPKLEMVRQISQMAAGQISVFFLTQLYENVESKNWQAVATSGIVACLGSAAAIYLEQLKESSGVVRLESNSIAIRGSQEVFRNIFLRRPVVLFIKVGATATFAFFYYQLNDPIWKGVVSFATSFFGFQIVGDLLISRINIKISRDDQIDLSRPLTDAQGSKYRLFKTGLTTLAFWAIPLAFIPFTKDAHTHERIQQLIYVGGVAGFFDQIIYSSQEERLTQKPIAQLEELQPHSFVDEVVYRISKIAYPVITFVGMTAFLIWQEGWDLDSADDRMALGFFFTGLCTAFPTGAAIDKSWNLKDRVSGHLETLSTRLKDKAFCSLLIAPRIFGVNPVYVYLVGTNLLEMNDVALNSEEYAPYRSMNFATWFFYGAATGIYMVINMSDKRGTLNKFPHMVILNGALTMKRIAAGEIP